MTSISGTSRDYTREDQADRHEFCPACGRIPLDGGPGIIHADVCWMKHYQPGQAQPFHVSEEGVVTDMPPAKIPDSPYLPGGEIHTAFMEGEVDRSQTTEARLGRLEAVAHAPQDIDTRVDDRLAFHGLIGPGTSIPYGEDLDAETEETHPFLARVSAGTIDASKLDVTTLPPGEYQAKWDESVQKYRIVEPTEEERRGIMDEPVEFNGTAQEVSNEAIVAKEDRRFEFPPDFAAAGRDFWLKDRPGAEFIPPSSGGKFGEAGIDTRPPEEIAGGSFQWGNDNGTDTIAGTFGVEAEAANQAAVIRELRMRLFSLATSVMESRAFPDPEQLSVTYSIARQALDHLAGESD